MFLDTGAAIVENEPDVAVAPVADVLQFRFALVSPIVTEAVAWLIARISIAQRGGELF